MALGAGQSRQITDVCPAHWGPYNAALVVSVMTWKDQQ